MKSKQFGKQCHVSLFLGGMDEFSWALCSDHTIRHNKQELHMINLASKTNPGETHKMQEGDIIGVSFDHIQLKFYVNGTEIEQSVTNVKGTVYPALYGKKFDNISS